MSNELVLVLKTVRIQDNLFLEVTSPNVPGLNLKYQNWNKLMTDTLPTVAKVCEVSRIPFPLEADQERIIGLLEIVSEAKGFSDKRKRRVVPKVGKSKPVKAKKKKMGKKAS